MQTLSTPNTEARQTAAREAFNKAIDNFDFDAVLKTMNALDWQWATIGRVPDMEDIDWHLEVLMMKAKSASIIVGTEERAEHNCASGGFNVIFKRDGEFISCGIEFTLRRSTGFADTL